MKKRWILGIIVMCVLIACNSSKNMITESHSSNFENSETISHTHNDYFAAYHLEDPIFGTKTSVTITGDKRIMVTNALPNHETGQFPGKGNPNTISAQNKNYTFPVNPKFTGTPQWVREPGVALNGVKFEPGTAEVVVCDTGENYRVEAFQDLINLGLDFNNAHVQPTGAYHYHGTPTSVIENFDTGKDLVHIGFAKDGFPIYFSKTEAYKSSYKLVESNREGEDCMYTNPKRTIEIAVEGDHDGTYTSDFEYVGGSGDLDECNGITIDGNYMYLVTSQFPYVSRCLMGEFTETERRGSRNRQEGRPSADEIIERMDANKDRKLSLEELKGPLKQEFSSIDSNKDGCLTKDEIEIRLKSRSNKH